MIYILGRIYAGLWIGLLCEVLFTSFPYFQVFFSLRICLAIYVFLAQGPAQSSADEVAEIKMLLETESNRRKAAEEEITHLKRKLGNYTQPEVSFFKWKTSLASVFSNHAYLVYQKLCIVY